MFFKVLIHSFPVDRYELEVAERFVAGDFFLFFHSFPKSYMVALFVFNILILILIFLFLIFVLGSFIKVLFIFNFII